jgi:hypothetical protein
MTLSSKLGASFDQVKDQIKIKPITLTIGEATFTLRVRVPVKREMESIVEAITNPPAEVTEAAYKRLSQPILDAVQEGGEAVAEAGKLQITDTDVIMDGTSVRQVATFTAMWETKVEKFFNLLQSETDEPINEKYAQIAEEFPESVIKQIIEEIEAAVRPDYKSAKKN